jgi:hypothetical protein
MSVASEMLDLKTALVEVDVLTTIARKTYGDVDWTVPDSANVEVVATLLGLIEKSSFTAMSVLNRLQRSMPDGKPAGEPGRLTMSAQDAEIVRRIRERDPDRRFDGGSDAELLSLFKHNKRVLERSDDDVIAAMTRPR